MKTGIKKDIIDLFIKELIDSNSFTEDEIEKIKLFSGRDELSSKAVIENFINSMTLKKENET